MDVELKMLDTVIATTNFPEHRVLAGDLGTIVEIYSIPDTAYEVEFVNPDGSTRALLTLRAPAGTFAVASRCVNHTPVAAGGMTSHLHKLECSRRPRHVFAWAACYIQSLFSMGRYLR